MAVQAVYGMEGCSLALRGEAVPAGQGRAGQGWASPGVAGSPGSVVLVVAQPVGAQLGSARQAVWARRGEAGRCGARRCAARKGAAVEAWFGSARPCLARLGWAWRGSPGIAWSGLAGSVQARHGEAVWARHGTAWIARLSPFRLGAA